MKIGRLLIYSERYSAFSDFTIQRVSSFHCSFNRLVHLFKKFVEHCSVLCFYYIIQEQFNHMSNFYENVPQKQPSKPNPPNKLTLDQNVNVEEPMFPMIAASSHPMWALMHIVLKIAVVVIYLLAPLVTKSFAAKEIVIVIAAVDFWIVKNVTGRLLVGLRWWVDFDEEGEEIWKFECKVNERDVNAADDKAFWWTLALFSLIWLGLIVINVFRIDLTNIMICVFCGTMIGFNLYSYYKCSKVQSENVKKLAKQYGNEMMGQFLYGSIVSNYF